MPLYKIYAGQSYGPLELVCIKEFENLETAEQYAFDRALDKVFPYQSISEENANVYTNVLSKIDYRAEEV